MSKNSLKLFWYSTVHKIFSLPDRILKYLLQMHFSYGVFHEGIFLGLLSKETLEQLSYRKYSKLNQYKSYEWNKRGFFEWETAIVQKYFMSCKNIMVLAAGGGREMIALKEFCLNSVGYESNENIRVAGNFLIDHLELDLIIHPSKINDCPIPEEVFDGIILGWGAYTHIIGRKQRLELLEKMKKSVAPGSPMLISFWSQAREYSFEKKVYNFANRIKDFFGKEKIENGDRYIGVFGHYFTKDEIRLELALAGLKMVEFDNMHYGYVVCFSETSN